MNNFFRLLVACMLVMNMPLGHAESNPANTRVIGRGMPVVDLTNAIYEVPVNPEVDITALKESLKSLSEGMNFVNPASFPIGEHMQLRGIDPQGVKEVHAYCNLGLGTEIVLDHPEFLVFAPCRIAIYQKTNAVGKPQLFLALDRPTFDLKNIKQPTPRAQAAAQALEDALIQLLEKARRGDF